MNRGEILGLVYDAILQRPTNTGAHWYICWVDHKIQCLPMNQKPKPEIIFSERTTREIRFGFTASDWTKLEAKIYTFLKGKGLCQIQ